jgi:phage-related protein
VDKKELLTELEGLKSTLETSMTEKTKSEIAEQLKSVIATIDEKINAFQASNDSVESVKEMTEEVNKIKAEQAAILKGFDILQTRVKNTKTSNVEAKKSFGQLFQEGLEANFDAIQNVKKGQPFHLFHLLRNIDQRRHQKQAQYQLCFPELIFVNLVN